MQLLRGVSVIVTLSVLVAACGDAPPVRRPVAAPVQPPTSTAAIVPGPEPKPSTPAIKVPSPEEIAEFLAPRPGETPADITPIAGIVELSEKEATTLGRCQAAKKKALERSAKLPFAKQFAAASKASDKVDKSCGSLELREQMQAMAKLRDLNAQSEMRILARGVAQTSCDTGAPNPHSSMGACFKGMESFLWDREGWSCMGKSLTDEDKQTFSYGSAYVYSFHTDETLKTFEIVGRGCSFILGSSSNAETELVLRGKLGDKTESLTFLRRAPTAK